MSFSTQFRLFSFLSFLFIGVWGLFHQCAFASLIEKPLIFERDRQKGIAPSVAEILPELSVMTYAAKCYGKLVAEHGGGDWNEQLEDTLNQLKEKGWRLLCGEHGEGAWREALEEEWQVCYGEHGEGAWREPLEEENERLFCGEHEASSITAHMSRYGHVNSKHGLLFRNDAQNMTVVALRGSIHDEGPLGGSPDWVANKDCGALRTEHDVFAHRGYIELADCIKEEISGKLRNFYERLDENLDGERIIFAGQSLGGALGVQTLIALLPELGNQIFGGDQRETHYDNAVENRFAWVGFSTPPSVEERSIEIVERIMGRHNMLSVSVDFDPKRLLLHRDFWWGFNTRSIRFLLGSIHSLLGYIGIESDILPFILEGEYFTVPTAVDIGHKADFSFSIMYNVLRAQSPEQGRLWALKQVLEVAHTRFNGFASRTITGESIGSLLNQEPQGMFSLLNTAPWLVRMMLCG